MNSQLMIAEILGDSNFIQDPNQSQSSHDDLTHDEFESIELPQEKKLQLAKRFIELVGGDDIAHDLIDKVKECSECLGLVDGGNVESDTIDDIADMVPSDVDCPTTVKRQIDMSNLYNPSSSF